MSDAPSEPDTNWLANPKENIDGPQEGSFQVGSHSILFRRFPRSVHTELTLNGVRRGVLTRTQPGRWQLLLLGRSMGDAVIARDIAWLLVNDHAEAMQASVPWLVLEANRS